MLVTRCQVATSETTRLSTATWAWTGKSIETLDSTPTARQQPRCVASDLELSNSKTAAYPLMLPGPRQSRRRRGRRTTALGAMQTRDGEA